MASSCRGEEQVGQWTPLSKLKEDENVKAHFEKAHGAGPETHLTSSTRCAWGERGAVMAMRFSVARCGIQRTFRSLASAHLWYFQVITFSHQPQERSMRDRLPCCFAHS